MPDSSRLGFLFATLAVALITTQSMAADRPVLRFQTYVLNDVQGGSGEVARMLIPAGWQTKGGLVWDLAAAFPAQKFIKIYDPKSLVSFGIYPTFDFFVTNGRSPVPPGQRYMGEYVVPPVGDGFDCMEKLIIPNLRHDLADLNAQVTNVQKTPKVSAYISNARPPGPRYQSEIESGWISYEYQFNGQPMQEDFFFVYRLDINLLYHYGNWEISDMLSVRAPKGSMDQSKIIHEVVARSYTPSLAWYNRYLQFLQARQKQAIRQIHEIGEISKIMAQEASAVEDATRASFEAQEAAEDAESEARAETTRGETPWDAGNGEKVLLPAEYGQAWSDGNGGYLVSNEPGYDPNSDPNNTGSWTSMQQLQH